MSDTNNVLRDRINDLNLALVELVTLKDHVKHEDPEDYKRRKPRAWQRARELLHSTTLGEVTKRMKVINDPTYAEMHKQLFEEGD